MKLARETDPQRMTDQNPSAATPITIKKYANRRLYNTASSAYVTLADLAAMVKAGEDFVVYDAKSGEDITRSVLTQIIFEQEGKEGQSLLPATVDPLLWRQRPGAAAALSRILDRPFHQRAAEIPRRDAPRLRRDAVRQFVVRRAGGAHPEEPRRLLASADDVHAFCRRPVGAAQSAASRGKGARQSRTRRAEEAIVGRAEEARFPDQQALSPGR